jgi:hypothetical protein
MAVAELITKSFSVAAVYDPPNQIVPALIERCYKFQVQLHFPPEFLFQFRV